MLGSIHYAKLIALIIATGAEPESHGFAHAGMGAYRNAYIGPDGNIYKVDRNKDAGKTMTGYNYSEWAGICEAQNIIPLPISSGAIVRLAQSQMYQVGKWFILCQEYVPNGSEYTYLSGYDYRAIQDWFGVEDLHAGNYRVDDAGDIVIVDYGFNSSHKDYGDYKTCECCGTEHYCQGKKENKVADDLTIAWGARVEMKDYIPF